MISITTAKLILQIILLSLGTIKTCKFNFSNLEEKWQRKTFILILPHFLSVLYIYIYIAINFYKRVCLLTDIEHINAFDFILSSCLTTNHHKEEFIYIETRIILV